MNEYIAALRRDYPAIDEQLLRYGDGSIGDYLGKIGHHPLPEILPSNELLAAVETVLRPCFGAETAAQAAAVLERQRCLSTANHHHFAFDYSTVQDTLLYEQWLRKNGEIRGIVPIFAVSNVNLKNVVYPRGIVLYDCALPEKRLRLPLFPLQRKHACVAGLEPVNPAMVRLAEQRLWKERAHGTIRQEMFQAISSFYEEILLSDAAQGCGSYREQTMVVNERLSQRYFTDRSPRYLWMPLEDIASELLARDLRRESSIPAQILFHRRLRECLLAKLDGVSGCWTGTTAGTQFFWGLDCHGVLFSMHLEEAGGEAVLAGTDSCGCGVRIPLVAEAVLEALQRRTLLPSMFLDFLETYFLRDFTVFGGYYQPTYLKRMQAGLVDAFQALGIFRREAEILAEKRSHATLGPTYLIRDRGAGAYRVSTAELLQAPISTAELEEALNMSLTDSYAMLIP